jgi:hypothetical protein
MARGAHSTGRQGRSGRSPARRSAGRSSGRRSAGRPSRQPRRRALRLPRFGNDPGDRLLAIGVVLFVLGLVAIGITFVPFVTLHRSNTDLAVNLGTFSTVIGLALAVFGAYRQARSLHK